MKNLLLLSLTFLFTFFAIRPSFAQTIEMSMVPDSTSSFELDYTRLLIPDSDQSLISGNFNFQYKHVLDEKFNLIGEFAFSTFKISGFDADSGLSNIFLGIQYKTSKKDHVNSALNVGIYLPSASEEAQNGGITNLFDFPKYQYKTTDIHLGYNYFYNYSNGLRLGFELGSDVSIPIGENSGDTELFGKYGVSLLYTATSGLYLQSELLGISLISEDGGFDENSFHTYSFGLGYNGKKVGAGLYYRNYFDDFLSNGFDGILGIEFTLFL